MFSKLKQWLVYGKLNNNEIIFQRINTDGVEEVFVIVDKWVFKRNDFLSCLNIHASESVMRWSKLSKEDNNTNEFSILKDSIINLWDKMGVEHSHSDKGYKAFFIEVINPLIKRIKLDETLFHYSGDRPMTLLLMLNEWEKIT